MGTLYEYLLLGRSMFTGLGRSRYRPDRSTRPYQSSSASIASCRIIADYEPLYDAPLIRTMLGPMINIETIQRTIGLSCYLHYHVSMERDASSICTRQTNGGAAAIMG